VQPQFYDKSFFVLINDNHIFRLFIPYFIWLTGVRIAIWNQLVEIWPFQNLYFYPKNSTFFHIQSMIFNFAYAQITTPRSSINSRISAKYIEKESSFTLYRRSPFSAHFLRRGRIHSIWPRTPLLNLISRVWCIQSTCPFNLSLINIQ